MQKSLLERLGSAFAHLQDLMDTAFHAVFKFSKNSENRKGTGKFIKEVGKFGDSYYQTYTKIKSKPKEK